MKAIHKTRPDLILLDMNMPGVSGLDLLRLFKQRSSSFPVIMLTSENSPSIIVECMKLGASDYVVKGTENFESELRFRISNIIRLDRVIKKQNELLQDKHQKEASQYEIMGISPEIVRLKSEITKYKGTPATVLITGENGTGKELVARTIHYQENKPTRPFVAVNCGAITPTLFESELFGHVKGSFTGAVADKAGYFSFANGGDVFLDEIGELSLDMQVKLLRVLQEKVIRPVGSVKEIAVNVRIIAATNRKLEELVRNGQFRQDLFFRLNQISIVMPSLRARRDDIYFLAQIFAEKFLPGAVITKAAREALENHPWPGNIRELSNTIERACIMIQGSSRPYIGKDDLMFAQIGEGGERTQIPNGLLPSDASDVNAASFRNCISWMEKTFFEKGLSLLRDDNKALIERLGISKALYYRKKRDLGILEDRQIRLV